MDYDGACEVTGGILAIAGSAGMAQAPGNTSTQNSLLVLYTLTQKAGTLATLADATENRFWPLPLPRIISPSSSALLPWRKGKLTPSFPAGLPVPL
jgi:hypothetical protein